MPESNAWTKAKAIAAQTPEKRNRYVDLLRALSIFVVVIGHWLIYLPAVIDGELRATHLLRDVPWTQWLTWLFHVMPVFFIVGGYANAASWQSAQRQGHAYSDWATARLQRLVGPVVPLLIFWALAAIIARQSGADPDLIQKASRSAFMPAWFLVVYIMVVMCTPLTWSAWRQYGLKSFWVLAGIALLIDIAAFAGGLTLLRWVNYVIVWLAVHQLGYLWQDGRLAGPAKALPWAIGGLAILIILVTVANYPVSMLTVPGAEVSNSRPATVALLALAAFHAGILLALERPARAWLTRVRPWAVTIMVNANIMTLYLWHITVMLLLVAVALLAGDIGLDDIPGTQQWLLTRPLWITIMLVLILGFVLVLAPFERSAKKNNQKPDAHSTAQSIPTWRLALGTLMFCSGLAFLVRFGLGNASALGVRVWVLVWTLTGTALLLQFSIFRRQR